MYSTIEKKMYFMYLFQIKKNIQCDFTETNFKLTKVKSETVSLKVMHLKIALCYLNLSRFSLHTFIKIIIYFTLIDFSLKV